MKKLLTVIAIIFLTSSSTIAKEKISNLTVIVDGMTCEACSDTLTKIFKKEESVNDITVNLDNQTITIDTKDGVELTDKKIKELIEWAGFDLIKINREK